MHLLFVDESGTPPGPTRAESDPVFVLAGLVVPDDAWPGLARGLEQAKRRYRVDGEVKWRYFAHGSNTKPNSLSHLSREDKDALRRELLGAVNTQESVKVIAVVVDTVEAYRTWPSTRSSDDLYHLAFKSLSERFQYCLQDLSEEAGSREYGLIVVDNRNNDQDNRLKTFHQRLLAGGNNKANYANLVEGLFVAASHHSPGTQFADLVAGAVFRKFARGDATSYELIEERVRRGPNGAVKGYGLVRMPPNKS